MTKLYLRNSTAANPPTAGEKSSVLPVGSFNSNSPSESLALGKSAGSSQVSIVLASLGQTAHQDGYIARFTSEGLAAQTFNSGVTYTYGIACSESNAFANTFIILSLYIWRPGNSSVVGYLYDSDTALGTEWATSETGRVVTFNTANSVTSQAGDVLVLEVWYDASQGMSSSYNNTIWFEGATDPVDGTGTSDAASYIDTGNHSITWEPITGSVSESSAIADAVSATQTKPVSVSESAAIADSVSSSLLYERSVEESSAITDTVSTTYTQAASVAESNAITDTVSATQVKPVSASESSAIADTLTASIITSASVSESATIEDTLSATKTHAASVAESAGFVDDPSAALETSASVAESAAISETISAFISSASSKPLKLHPEQGFQQFQDGDFVALDHGGTGGTTAEDARVSLGLVIGTDIQAFDATLETISTLTPTSDQFLYFTGTDTAATGTVTPFIRTVMDDVDALTARATLGLVIGTNVQAWDAELQSIANLVSAADRLPYFTGSGSASLAVFTGFGRSLVDDADAAAGRSTLGVVIGTNVQAFDADLAAIAALSGTGIAVRTAADTWAQRSLANASSGLTWTNADGVSGNPTPVFANDLGALEGLSGTGIAVRSATDTWLQRSLAVASTARLTVTNADGISGNPTFDLATVSDGGTGTFLKLTRDSYGRVSGTAAVATADVIGLGGIAASGTNTDITSVFLNNTGLKIKDTDASHGLRIVPGSNITADRTLTFTTGDADRTLTINSNTTLGGGTHSGTNTGDQTITLTGDVTGSGTGSFAATIGNNVVTYGKFQQASAGFAIIAKATTGGGNYAELTAGADSILMRSGSGNLIFGTVVTNQIGASQVTDAKLRDSSGLSVVGRSANTTGAVADITASADFQVLRRSGTTLGFGAVDLSQSGAVTGILGSSNGGTGINNAGRTLTVNTNSGTLAFSSASLTLTVAAAASVSGTNTGDQTITLTGDVTGSGTGSFATTISDDTVTAEQLTRHDISNLVDDGDFESLGNRAWGTGTGWTVMTDGTDARTGLGYARYNGTSTTTLTSQDYIPVAEGDQVYCEAWIKSNGAGTVGTARYLLTWYTAAKAIVSNIISSPTVTSGTTYTKSVAAGTAPATAAYFRIRLQPNVAPTDGRVFFFDDVYAVRRVITDYLADSAVTFAKIQNVSAQNRLLGRSSAGAGIIEEIATIPSAILGNSSLFIGTTSIALNRTSGSQTLTGTSVDGNAGTATALQTARTINGVSFNGTANITVTAAAGTLTGATLASGVTASSLTSFGTLAGVHNVAQTSYFIFAGGASRGIGFSYGSVGETYSAQRTIIGNNIYVDPNDTVSDQVRYRNSHSTYGHTILGMAAGEFSFWGQSANVTAGAVVSKNLSATLTASGVFNAVGGLQVNGTNVLTTASTVSALTTVGTITSGTWQGSVINSTYGGTGINNAGRTLTINTNSGAITYSSASLTLTVAAAASVSGTNTGDQTTVSGNAGTATTLQTARTINGTSFNGSANITTSSWGTSRTLTIGSTGKAVDGSGNVSWSLIEIGVGTSSNVQFSSFGVGTAASGTAGEIRATNNITAFYSDKRLKEDIQIIENALAKVMRLRGVTFVENALAEKFGFNSKRRQAGVIAQEVEREFPVATTLAPFDIGEDGKSKSGENYLTVRGINDGLIPLLLEAIKELGIEVRDLKKQRVP